MTQVEAETVTRRPTTRSVAGAPRRANRLGETTIAPERMLGAAPGSIVGELRGVLERLAAAGAAERGRIERDLHDGAQQRIVALLMSLAPAHENAATKPELAAQLDRVVGELKGILDDLRDLVHGVYPPLLRDFGLPAALAAAANRTTPPTRLDLADVGRYDSELEVAVYFSCLEALQNVAKHAGPGARATIRLREQDDRLELKVVDVGGGFDTNVIPGDGTTNMSDRFAALGGILRIESTPGRGTRVLGSMPTR